MVNKKHKKFKFNPKCRKNSKPKIEIKINPKIQVKIIAGIII